MASAMTRRSSKFLLSYIHTYIYIYICVCVCVCVCVCDILATVEILNNRIIKTNELHVNKMKNCSSHEVNVMHNSVPQTAHLAK